MVQTLERVKICLRLLMSSNSKSHVQSTLVASGLGNAKQHKEDICWIKTQSS